MKKTRTNCIILSLSFLDGVWLFVVFFLPHLLLIVVVMVLVRDLSTAEWVLLRGMLAAHNKPNLVHDDLLVVELLDAHLAQVLLSEQMYLGAFEVLSQGGPVVRHIEMPLSEQLHPRTDTQTDRQTGSQTCQPAMCGVVCVLPMHCVTFQCASLHTRTFLQASIMWDRQDRQATECH